MATGADTQLMTRILIDYTDTIRSDVLLQSDFNLLRIRKVEEVEDFSQKVFSGTQFLSA